jgi:hypothetical protein
MTLSQDSTHQKHSPLRIAVVTAAVSTALGLIFNFLFFDKSPGISFPIFTVLTLAGLYLVAKQQGHVLPRTALYMVPLLLFFSGMVFLRANGALVFCNIVLTLYLLALMVRLTARPRLDMYGFRDYLRLVLEMPIDALGRANETLRTLIGHQAFLRKHPVAPHVVRGVLIALPVLLIFVGLFASADLVFRQYVGDLFDFNLSDELIGRTILLLVVTGGLIGLFGLIGRMPQSGPSPSAVPVPEKGVTPAKGMVETTILFGSLNALFLCFIIVQLAYLFGGADNVIHGNFTYAEYARKGFFELITVAGLSFLLVLVADRSLLRRVIRHTTGFKVLAGALIVQVLIIMASALKRLQLYEGAYGFTADRLFGHACIIWLAVVLAVLLYKIVADKREQTLVFALFISVLVFVGTLNILNVDGFVARQNIARYNATGKLDMGYLQTLSADGVPQIAKLLDSQDTKLRSHIASLLYQERQELLAYPSDWRSANLGRSRALHTLDRKIDILKAHAQYAVPPPNYGP